MKQTFNNNQAAAALAASAAQAFGTALYEPVTA